MGERWTKLLESWTDSYLLVQSLPTHDDMRFKTPLNNVKAADPDYFLDPSSGMKDGQPNYLEEREEFSIDRVHIIFWEAKRANARPISQSKKP